MTRIEFELTSDDFSAFNLHHALTNGPMLGQMRRSRVLASLAMFLMTLPIWIVLTDSLVQGLVAGGVGAAAMWFVFPWTWRRSLSGQLRRMSAQGGLGTPGPRELTVGDEGVLQTWGGIGLSAAWAAVERVDVVDDYVFVYIGPAFALVVPRRIGESDVALILGEIGRYRGDLVQPGLSNNGIERTPSALD